MDKSKIFKSAWEIARRMARESGMAVRSMFGLALRKAWAKAKLLAACPSLYDAKRRVTTYLQMAAGRCGRREGASARQTEYLASLMLDAGDVLDAEIYRLDITATLTVRDASKMIDRYLGK